MAINLQHASSGPLLLKKSKMKKHIFLIDDDKEEMLVFTEALRRVPVPSKCTWARSGEQALQQLAYLTPDVIFLDLVIPGMDGLECLEAIRSIPRLQGIPVIVLSPALSMTARSRALALGASNCLSKSKNSKELADALRTVLDASATTTAT